MKKSDNQPQDIPAPFLKRMSELLGREYDAFLSSLHQPAIIGLRVNTLKISTSEFMDHSAWRLSPVPWCKTGFIVNSHTVEIPPTQPGKHPYHAAGLFYLQEPSAMAAAEILAPKPGEKVLDLAAAPGGKTTHLAALMNQRGTIIANEIHPKRVWDLVENLERCGVTNAVITNDSPQKLSDHLVEYFDRVLLDAPCSGEGMFRKGEIARQEWRPELTSSCAARQAAILEQAARMVKPGGHLAYTTCTFSPDENEGVIARFLQQHSEFELETVRHVAGFSPGRPDWIGLLPDDPLVRAVRIWPHLAEGEGHFMALLVKHGATTKYLQKNNLTAAWRSTKGRKSTISTNALSLFNDFCRRSLSITFDPARLAMVGSYVYHLPDDAVDLDALKVVRQGWWLGSIQKGRFTPSHSLAMGLKRDQAIHTLTLPPDDPYLTAYFAGASLTNSGENAWVLITVAGYPIGWGKRVQNVIKNYYPHGLRRAK